MIDGLKITAIVPYFGSKRTMAPLIVEELGPHHTYFEPFCGSCAVLIAKPKCRMETVNDLNGDLVNLIRVVCHTRLGPMLYRQCRRMLMSEMLFREASARWKEMGRLPADEIARHEAMSGLGEPPGCNLAAAVDYFFASWLGRNGVTGTESNNQGFAARYTPNGGHGGTRFQSAVISIPKWRKRMRDVTVLNRDGFALLEKIEDASGVAIYCDPPYVEKNSKYIHDFVSEDHERLAGLLNRFQQVRIVVSYYDHPTVRELYAGWTIRHTPQTKGMVQGNGRKKGAVIAPEVLIINGASIADTAGQQQTIFK